jgi:hypothetical protein
MLTQRAAIATTSLLIATALCRADELPASQPAPNRLTVHGLVDVYYAVNFNHPADGASFAAGQGSTAKRANEASLNLAAVELTYAPAPIGAELMLVYGTGTEVLHGGETPGTAVGSSVWHNVYRAALTFKQGDFALEAGIYPCHLGFESFLSRDNWTYSRSWLGENQPYYVTGVKASYALTDHLSAQLHVYNGWQVVGDNNDAKSFGTQLAWSSELLSVAFNTHAGPETPGDNDHWRLFGELVAQVNPTPQVSIATQLDAGWQQRAGADASAWQGAGLFARVAVTDAVTLAGRGEVYHDPDGTITGVGQTAAEGTLCVELKPRDDISIKLEGRYDHSDAAVFTRHETGADGKPLLTKDEALAVLGAVVSF